MKKTISYIRFTLCIVIIISFLYTTFYLQNIQTELNKKESEIHLLKIKADQLSDMIEGLNKRVEEAENDIELKKDSSLQ